MTQAVSDMPGGVIRSVASLFVGLALVMVATGLVGSLVAVRSELEAFPTVAIGAIMAMYYAGFLVGSLTIPRGLASVGHVRVFTGLA